MSELKAFNCVDSDVQEFCEPRLVYLKSEADDEIAEKDEKIDELQKATDSAWSKVNTMYDELLHHKYKRCLAMYRYCSIKALYELDFKGNDVEWKWYSKWMHKWFDLAKKFKEA